MLRTTGYFCSALELIKYFVLFPNPYLSSSTQDSSTPTPNCPEDVCSTLLELFEIRTYLFLLFLLVFTYPVSPTFYVLRGIPNLSRFISEIIFSMMLSLRINFLLPHPEKRYTFSSLHSLLFLIYGNSYDVKPVIQHRRGYFPVSPIQTLISFREMIFLHSSLCSKIQQQCLTLGAQ